MKCGGRFGVADEQQRAHTVADQGGGAEAEKRWVKSWDKTMAAGRKASGQRLEDDLPAHTPRTLLFPPPTQYLRTLAALLRR